MTLVSSLDSCKKAIDKAKEDYVLSVMTQGRWFLENYTDNGIDNTSDFAAYEFQFYDTGKLDAINTTSSSIESGTWAGDVNNITLTVNLTTSTEPLKRLNHVWQFIKANVGLAFAETTTPNGKISIRLRKK